MELDKVDYKKELKELDKQTDRIKTAYIKGIVKLDEFDKELKQIDFQKKTLAKEKNVDEELKVTDQMKWVGLMNNFKLQAKEIVLAKLIYI